MKIRQLCSLCEGDIVEKSIADENLECDFTLGIHHVYTGCNVDLPITEGFCNIYATPCYGWERFLSKNEKIHLMKTSLFIIYDTGYPVTIPEVCKSTNVIYLRFSEEVFFQRISNLTAYHHLSPDAESLYAAFWEHISSSRSLDYVNTGHYLKQMPFPLHEYLSIIVVKHFSDANNTLYLSGDNANLPLQELSALRTFFQKQNVFYVPKTKEIIVLYSQQTPDNYAFYYPLHDFSYLKFSEFLGKYHLHAGLSNSGRAIEHIYTMYLTAQSALNLGEQLKQRPHFHCIYHLMEYAPYAVIDQCVPEFHRRFGHDNFIYMTHPSIMILYRYDLENNTQLLETLYTYLSTGHSISETANQLYIHRNTVCNRIKKINELTNLSIDNPQVQTILLLSCQIFLYYRDVMRKKL